MQTGQEGVVPKSKRSAYSANAGTVSVTAIRTLPRSVAFVSCGVHSHNAGQFLTERQIERLERLPPLFIEIRA